MYDVLIVKDKKNIYYKKNFFKRYFKLKQFLKF